MPADKQVVQVIGEPTEVTIGSVETLGPGQDATVTNTGSGKQVVLNFGLPTGPTGGVGAQGPTGETGPTGPKGADGVAATVVVGTVTTGAPGTSVSVTNTGTSSAAEFNFTIPQGATGAQGPKGETGPAGATPTFKIEGGHLYAVYPEGTVLS